MCVWKLIPIDNVGNENVYGGDDTKKLNKYHAGYDLTLENVSDKVEIGTPTTFFTEKLRIKSPTTGYSYIFKSSDIEADRYIILPLMTQDSEIALAATSSVNDWGTNMQTFRSENFRIMNPANTFGYKYQTSAITSNVIVNLPPLTTDDEFLFANASQTLINKTLVSPTISAMTIETDANTIKHSTTNLAGDLLVSTGSKFDRFARGTANQVPIMNATGTGLTWVDKSSLAGSGGGGGGSGTGDFQFPLVNNVISGAWFGTTIGGASGLWSGFLTNTSTVTPTNIVDTSGRIGLRFALTSDNAVAGFKTNAVHFTRLNDPELWVRYKMDVAGQDNEIRVNVGFCSDMAVQFDTGTNLLSNLSAFMWYMEDVDTAINVGRNDADTTTDRDNTVTVAYTDANIHTVRLFGDSANNRFGISLDGANATYYTTEIPAATTRLGCYVQFINDDSNTRNIELYGAYFKAKVI